MPVYEPWTNVFTAEVNVSASFIIAQPNNNPVKYGDIGFMNITRENVNNTGIVENKICRLFAVRRFNTLFQFARHCHPLCNKLIHFFASRVATALRAAS